ncbi:CopG family ribbon-helix-helix protein [Methanospirillum lacunae]|uniref:Ribbon-helix-helix protein CopG domain-containing protein n=1 Tax=Methanospirillum lacunae TaxID=668570 RepID=A0A2V2N463_9EURY|nr:ribbon-helix-helix domain-containing protein [Methanospirillum lacunae]PWR71308.1 hypothetical protein DK846_10595 [Methanospirillum lacunae]
MKRRYNITLTPEMDEKLNHYAYVTRKSRSSLIEEALDQYLAGKDDGSRSSHDDVSVLKERMELLEAKIQRIETRDCLRQEPVQSRTQNFQEKNSPVISQTPQCQNPDKMRQNLPLETEVQSVISLDPDGWYTQTLVSEFLDQSVLPSTRKSIVSLAVARGEMETNGKKRKGCRIKGSSAIRWIISMRKKDKPPVFFLGSH